MPRKGRIVFTSWLIEMDFCGSCLDWPLANHTFLDNHPMYEEFIVESQICNENPQPPIVQSLGKAI